MRMVSRSVLLFCFVNLVRVQIEAEDSESKVPGGSEWWSKRITKINGNREIGLRSEDSERQSRRWEDEETGEAGRRPRPFALRVPETRDRFGSERENFREGEGVAGDLFNWEHPAPSPILLPPRVFSTLSPAYHRSTFQANDLQSPWSNESSHAGKSSGSSAVDRIRIYEITTFNTSSNEKPRSKQKYGDDSSKTSDRDNENRWVDFVQKSSVNVTKNKNLQPSDGGAGQNRSFYIDEARENRRSSKPASNRSNLFIKSSRGSRKYQGFESEKTFMRKQALSTNEKYDWQRRPPAQTSSQLKFNEDSTVKIGAVPGVPGRDYPVHQEHTHHNLRNVADRFPCPRTPKTHVYLADRASRCQIFYVCYGSKTGVPMVCPNGTLFSEPLQVCDWWYNVSC